MFISFSLLTQVLSYQPRGLRQHFPRDRTGTVGGEAREKRGAAGSLATKSLPLRKRSNSWPSVAGALRFGRAAREVLALPFSRALCAGEGESPLPRLLEREDELHPVDL